MSERTEGGMGESVNCPIREHTADGAYVGRCDFWAPEGICPRHGCIEDYPTDVYKRIDTAIDGILKGDVDDGIIGADDRKRLRYCIGAAVRRELEIHQGPTCHRCGNSWARRDQAERQRDEVMGVLREIADGYERHNPGWWIKKAKAALNDRS